MKSLKNVFAALAFVLAFGAASATSTLESVRLKDDNVNCQPISCVIGDPTCTEGDFESRQFYELSDTQCNGSTVIAEEVTPK